MRLFSKVALTFAALLFSTTLIICAQRSGNLSIGVAAQNSRSKTAARSQQKKPRPDYARFSHLTHVTQKGLSCDQCHKFPTSNWKDVRKGDAAFPDVAEFPEHSSCLSCHRQQFFARERPAPTICSNCHVNVTPRNTLRFVFPSLGDVADDRGPRTNAPSEFAIHFPHDKHIDVVGRVVPGGTPKKTSEFVSVSWQESAAKDAQLKSCPVCHETYQPQGSSDEEYVTKQPKDLGDAFWLKKGTFKTVPNSHAKCATCHNADVGIEPMLSACNSCHKLSENDRSKDFDPTLVQTMGITDQVIVNRWERRQSSGTYRHEGGEHPNLACTKCHDVLTMNTAEPKSVVVSVRTCGGAEGCHITATTDDGGILNYEIDQKKANANSVCTKCHITFGKSPTPGTHMTAVQALKKP